MQGRCKGVGVRSVGQMCFVCSSTSHNSSDNERRHYPVGLHASCKDLQGIRA